MSTPYLPVPDLIQRIEDRSTFPASIADDELHQLVNAAERLIGRARQELVNRRTAQLWAEQGRLIGRARQELVNRLTAQLWAEQGRLIGRARQELVNRLTAICGRSRGGLSAARGKS